MKGGGIGTGSVLFFLGRMKTSRTRRNVPDETLFVRVGHWGAPNVAEQQRRLVETVILMVGDEGGFMKLLEPGPEDDALQWSAELILSIVNSRREVAYFSAELERRWKGATDHEIDQAVFKGGLGLNETTQLLFLQAQWIAFEAFDNREHILLQHSLVRLARAGVYVARGLKRRMPQGSKAALEFSRLASDGIRIPPKLRAELARMSGSIAEEADWSLFIGGHWDENSISRAFKSLRKVSHQNDAIAVPVEASEPSVESAADLLAVAAGRQEQEVNRAGLEFEYDRSDAEVRLSSVELIGVRGVPGKLKLSFGKKDNPSSALIFGENGTGKSTIVDAIEFALQGRIGRSTHYDSPVAPALRSLNTTGESRACVRLSDGSSVERTAVLTRDGKVIAHPLTVRPGFRLAPITIKRGDLLNFLDTEALSRGTILLDYFPVNAESLAVRPSERVILLQAEITELRIKRTSYAMRLSSLLGVDVSEVNNLSGFNKKVKDLVFLGKTLKNFSAVGGWEKVDPELRSVIRQLSDTFKAMGVAKKYIQDKDNALNPMLHREQTLLLKAALQDIGAEITFAFRGICHEHQVERIDIVLGESGPLSLDLVVRLNDGKNYFPQQLFSEAYRDLLALLFFTAVARRAAAKGQARILILDDVLQSVDATVRQAFVEHILDKFRDWQLIFTVHDRLWLERLRGLFNAHHHKFMEHQIRRWDAASGPELQVPGADAMTKDLEFLILNGEPDSIAGKAGPLLEYVCRELCSRFRLPVPYNRERMFTLHDLWTSTYNSLNKTRLAGVLKRLDSVRGLRNLAAHGDPRALELSSTEAASFGKAVLDLYADVRCRHCKRWVNEGRQCDPAICITDIRLDAGQ